MKITKENISNKLLKILEGGVATTIDIAWAMSASKSVSRKRWSLLRNSADNSIGGEIIKDWKYNRSEYQRYYSLLNNLEKQGLIGHTHADKNKSWVITQAGISYIKSREHDLAGRAALVVAGGATVVSYDIPERMRSERGKLRETLKLIGFEQAQQSVWFGNKKVTKKFLELLRERRIFQYIHIFEINQVGTLKKVT